MSNIRSVWNYGLFALVVLSLGAATIRADEPSSLTEPVTAVPDLQDSELTPLFATAEESTTETKATAADEVSAADTESEVPSGKPELVREHYPNGSLKVERQMIQDDAGNYIHHGPWKNFDERGNVTAQGSYFNGERHGVWTRWYRAGQAELLTRTPYREFGGPFISQATFEHGKLHGKWMIYDAKQNKCSELEFVGGMRHGTATWWYANKAKMREVNYRDGQIDGTVLEWSADGKLSAKDTYQLGRKLALKTQYHTASQKKTEGLYLFAAQVVSKPDSWWDAQLATYTTHGKDERHGIQTTWYPSGQKQIQGEYRNDVQVGRFTWWLSNGQIAIEGSFNEGKQTDLWVWRHANGQKSIQGKYLAGDPSGRWNWWNAEGKLTQTLDMSNRSSAAHIPALPSVPEPTAGRGAAPSSRSPARR